MKSNRIPILCVGIDFWGELQSLLGTEVFHFNTALPKDYEKVSWQRPTGASIAYRNGKGSISLLCLWLIVSYPFRSAFIIHFNIRSFFESPEAGFTINNWKELVATRSVALTSPWIIKEDHLP